jgi:hypothetical protein
MKFLDAADQLRIIVHIMPPHSTHRLQPLDVGLFSPLATAYKKALNNIMHKGLGMVYMTKRLFWPMFKESWKLAFTEKNVLHSFEKPGIFPYNPDKILHILHKAVPEPLKQAIVPQTPLACKAVRKVHRLYRLDPTVQNLSLILRANIRLAAEASIKSHIIEGLTESLKLERKKRQRGKKLNLLGESDVGPQFFSPTRIQADREFQAAKIDAEHIRKQAIADKKAASIVLKEQRTADKAARIIQRQLQRQHVAELKAQKVAEQAAIRAAIVVAKEQDLPLIQVSNFSSNRPKTPKRLLEIDTATVVGRNVAKKVKVVESVFPHTPATTKRGRAIILPQRFN